MHNPRQSGSGSQGPQYEVERRPYRGVRDTVRYMVEFIQVGQTHPDVRNAAISATRDVYPHDYTSELAALYYEACRRVKYVRDPANAEMLHAPHLTLRTGAGDCDDAAVVVGAMAGADRRVANPTTALGTLSASVGVPVQVVTAGYDSPRGEHSHTFLRAWDSRRKCWIVLDTVAGPHTAEMIARVQGFTATDVPTQRKGG